MRTCKTCEFGHISNNLNVTDNLEQPLNEGFKWDCLNPDFKHDQHYNQAPHDKTNSLCINCPVYEQG